MKLEHIKLFIQVVESGSINQAAKQAYITNQGLSQAVKQIESELGITLFHRSNKGMQLTPEGEKFYQYAIRSIQLYTDFLNDLYNEDGINTFNFYLSSNDYNILPYLSNAPFMKENNWFFNYMIRSNAECTQLINNNLGIYFFSFYGTSTAEISKNFISNFPIYKVGCDTSRLRICHKDSALQFMTEEEQLEIMQKYKCLLFFSPDYNLQKEIEPYQTICVPDLDSYKKLLKERDTYTILTYSQYNLHFDPTEYIVLHSAPLQTEINYYVAFHLTENEKNKRIEQSLVQYLEQLFEKAAANTNNTAI